MIDERDVLGPSVAGLWYPAAAAELSAQVDLLLRNATPEHDRPPPPCAIIAPHAGYVYSGAVAARGFAAARGSCAARVLLLGPSHHHAFPGAAVPESARYRTPLGDVPIDREATTGLRDAEWFRGDDGPFGREHSLEAEIPFLQRTLDAGWRLVPVLIGAGTSRAASASVARSLSAVVDDDTLVVVSSDFTHFGSRFGFAPFREQVDRRIAQLDRGAIDRILDWDVDDFERYVDSTGATICGRDAIGILMRLWPERRRGSLAAYDTSGRMTGDSEHSVSYASLVFDRANA